MLLIGYAYGIRSERRLCGEVHLNLAYRWFCRLGLDGAVPDHSTFSKNRYGRFRESDVYRVLFEDVISQCMSAGLVGGEGFAVDSSLIGGDAGRDRRVETVDAIREGNRTRPVREYLDALDADNPVHQGDARYLSPTSLVLATLGGAAGLIFAYLGLRALVISAPTDLPRIGEISIDSASLSFALCCALSAGLLFGFLTVLK
jgi:hypothetical protein